MLDDDENTIPTSPDENYADSVRSPNRKTPIRLNAAALRTTNAMMSQSVSPKDIIAKTGQSLRTAQRHYKRFLSLPSVGQETEFRYKKCGAQKADDSELKAAIEHLIRIDNAMTLRGILI